MKATPGTAHIAALLVAWLEERLARATPMEEREAELVQVARALKKDPAALERAAVLAALKKHKNDRDAAADELGLSRSSFFRSMRDLDLFEAADAQAKALGFRVYTPGSPRAESPRPVRRIRARAA